MYKPTPDFKINNMLIDCKLHCSKETHDFEVNKILCEAISNGIKFCTVCGFALNDIGQCYMSKIMRNLGGHKNYLE